MAVARELTKLHEEFFRGRVSGAVKHYTANPPRGEITLVLAGGRLVKETWSEQQLRLALEEAKSKQNSPTQIARQLAQESGWPRREIYQILIDME